jgi:hypothetical protein
VSRETKQRTSMGIDDSGGSVVDPTENVKALQLASAARQDDLRDLNDRRIDAEIRVLKTEVNCIENIAVLRAEHAKEIRILESDRLEKIRQVDVLAGNTAADRALIAIQTLATSQAAAAETLRSMVTTTATTIAAQTSDTVSQITERIAALEKSSYEGAGKGTGAKNLWGILAAAIGLLVMLFMGAITIGGVIVAIAYAIRK